MLQENKINKPAKIICIGCMSLVIVFAVSLFILLNMRRQYIESKERKFNYETHLIHGIRQLRPNMTKEEVEKILPSKFKIGEDVKCPDGDYLFKRKFSDLRPYSKIYYDEYTSSGVCHVSIFFDQTDKIVGLCYNPSGSPKLRKDELVFPPYTGDSETSGQNRDQAPAKD